MEPISLRLLWYLSMRQCWIDGLLCRPILMWHPNNVSMRKKGKGKEVKDRDRSVFWNLFLLRLDRQAHSINAEWFSLSFFLFCFTLGFSLSSFLFGTVLASLPRMYFPIRTKGNEPKREREAYASLALDAIWASSPLLFHYFIVSTFLRPLPVSSFSPLIYTFYLYIYIQ